MRPKDVAEEIVSVLRSAEADLGFPYASDWRWLAVQDARWWRVVGTAPVRRDRRGPREYIVPRGRVVTARVLRADYGLVRRVLQTVAAEVESRGLEAVGAVITEHHSPIPGSETQYISTMSVQVAGDPAWVDVALV